MTQNPLESTYRPIRRIAPPDVPIAGLLAAEGDNTVLLVDLDAIPASWWRDETTAHLLTPTDVARRSDGHDAVLPWCVVTVVSYLRARAQDRLSGGEAVTLAVSLMRGCAEVAQLPRDSGDGVMASHGRWWLTDQGRPLFAFGDGGPARDETADLLALLAESCEDRAVVRLAIEAADSLRVRAPVPVLRDLEDRLFEACAPRPLLVRVSDATPPRPLDVRELRSTATLGDEPDDERPRFIGATVRRSPRPGVSWTRTAGDLLEQWREARAPRRRESAGRRRAPLLLGVFLAAGILTVGLLWPPADPSAAARPDGSSGGAPATGNTNAGGTPSSTSPTDAGASTPPSSSAVPPPEADAEPPQSESPEPSEAESPRTTELLAAGAALLAAVQACETTEDCQRVLAAGVAADEVPAGGLLELVEDFGGVAVLRVVADGGDTRMVSIERVDDSWRVRDVLVVPR